MFRLNRDYIKGIYGNISSDPVFSLLCIMLVFSCLTYAGTFEIFSIRIFISEFIYCVIGIPLLLFHYKKINITLIINKFSIILAGFFLLHIFSFFMVMSSMNHAEILSALKELIRISSTLTFIYLLILYFKHQNNSQRKIILLIKSFIFAGIFVSIYAIYQVISVKIFSKYISLIPNSSIVPNNNGRGVGTFMEGGYAVLFIGIALWFLVYLFKLNQVNKRNYYMILFTLLIGILVTQSTAGIISLLISAIFYFLISSADKYKYIFIVSLIPFFIGAYFFFKDKFQSMVEAFKMLFIDGNLEFIGHIDSYSAADRLHKSLKAFMMFKEEPIFGVGIGQYSVLYDKFPPSSLTADIGTVVPLNIFAQILGELGLVGILIFLYLFYLLFKLADPILKIIIVFIALNFLFYPSYKMFFIWATVGLIFIASENIKHSFKFSYRIMKKRNSNENCHYS
jgi:O-antigen ligase